MSLMKEEIILKVANALIQASSTFSNDKIEVYQKAILNEENENARWVLEQILENANIASLNRKPLCDDTGIPHVLIEVGPNHTITGEILDAIDKGIKRGLENLPGRPMGIKGDMYQRIDQSGGLNIAPSGVDTAPFIVKNVKEDVLRVNILMLGGGPAIRAKTYRVFHKHSIESVREEIANWAIEIIGDLGCTPATLAVGIGRSHFEASEHMIEAMVYGRYDKQNELEKYITDKVNEAKIGPLGMGGKHSVLGTFVDVGPQRASGVRIVCMRPCCCFEPRLSKVEL